LEFWKIWVGLLSGVFSVAFMARAAALTTNQEAFLLWMAAYASGLVAAVMLWWKQHIDTRGLKETEKLAVDPADATRARLLLAREALARLYAQLGEAGKPAPG